MFFTIFVSYLSFDMQMYFIILKYQINSFRIIKYTTLFNYQVS
nr:MAG TPA: hypothetical protein [Caudoviricetes sp.]